MVVTRQDKPVVETVVQVVEMDIMTAALQDLALPAKATMADVEFHQDIPQETVVTVEVVVVAPAKPATTAMAFLVKLGVATEQQVLMALFVPAAAAAETTLSAIMADLVAVVAAGQDLTTITKQQAALIPAVVVAELTQVRQDTVLLEDPELL